MKSSWTYKFTIIDLFFNPMVLAPIKIKDCEISERGYSSYPLFETQAEALHSIQMNLDILTFEKTIDELDLPTVTFKKDPLKKVILFKIFKVFMIAFVYISLPIMRFQLQRFINYSKKTAPETWI